MRSLRRLLCAVAALFLAMPCAYSAESPTASAPVPTALAPQADGQNAPGKTPTIKVQSNLVLVDVVVTKNGAPVKGLTKDKFRVQENGKERELKVFEEHSEETQAATATNAPANPSAPKAPALPPNTYSDFTPYPPSSSVNILLLDALNTLTTDQAQVRKEMLAYLKKIPPGTRMAVFTLSSRLRMIQGFTADPSVLAKAITEKGEITPSLADAAKASYEEEEEVVANTVAGQASGVGAAIDMQQFAADLKSYNTDMQEEKTMEAMRQIARYLGTIPGRKNLIWFSGSFPLNIDPVAPDSRITLKDPYTGETVADYRNPRDNRTTRDYATEVRETDRLLTAARIAVYPVDAHGLLAPESSFDASVDVTSILGLAGAAAPERATGRVSSPHPSDSIHQIGTAQTQAADESRNEGSTLQQVAQDTGGKAFVNSNAFQDAIKQALADGAHYYTIGYVPEGQDDGQFRHIKIKLDGGYELAYRDGYYADTPGHGADSQATTMQEATQFGAPPPSEIPFKVRVIAASDPAAEGFTPAAGPAGAEANKLKAPVTRYLVDYMVDAHRFAFSKTEDGVEHARLEFAVLAYDADGKMINLTEHAFALDLPPAVYAQVLSGGFPQHQEIDLPAGEVFLRIVVHDLGSAKAGATEVPLVVAKR